MSETPKEADATLLALIARGDVMALGRLYDRYAPIVFPVALRILRSRAEAEDALHDAFVMVHQRASQYEPSRGSVSSWLVTLVRNLCIDRARRKQRQRKLSDQQQQEPQAATAMAAPPDALVAAAADRDRVRRALDTLPAEQRETLLIAFFEGLSYPEIAERAGIPLGTVKARAARAIAALRERLAK